MAYSHVWSDTVPTGSLPANQIDTAIQDLRLDLDERLVPLIFNTPFTADPLVVNPALLGNVTAKHLYVGFDRFYATDADQSNADEYRFDTGGGATYRATLDLPVGCTITRAKLQYNSTGDSVTWKVYRVPFVVTIAVAADVFANIVATVNAIDISDSGVLNHPVDDAYIYRVKAVTVNNARIYGVEITYSTPDCRNTR